MKTKAIYCFFIFSFWLWSLETIAQENPKLSVFYKYSILKLQAGKFYYPLGFGSSISLPFANRIILIAGIDYSYLHSYNDFTLTNSEYRTIYESKESIYSLITGLNYPLFQKKISLEVGGDIVSSYFHSFNEVSKINKTSNSIEIHSKKYLDMFGLGFKAKLDIEYSLFKNISAFIQPGFTYYLVGDVKKEKYYSVLAGARVSVLKRKAINK